MTAVGYVGGGAGTSGVTSVDGDTGVVVLTDDYAPIVHLHTGAYAVTGHDHDARYYTETEADSLLAGYSITGHAHNNYAITGHAHSDYSVTGHGHSEYAVTVHTHNDYSITGHAHDDRYFTEGEVTTSLNTKSDTGHLHTGTYAVTGHAHSDYANTIHAHNEYAVTGHASTHLDGGTDEVTILRAQISDLNALVAALVNNGNSLLTAGGIETLSRFGQNEFDGVSGRLWVSYFTSPMDLPNLMNLAMASAGGSGVGITLARVALFTSAPDGSLTLVARTANDTTIGDGSYTTYDRLLSTAGGFPASYSPVSGGRYAMGFLQVAATPCKITGSFIVDGGTSPVPSRYIDGQADIANTYAVGTLQSHFTMSYFRARP